MIDKLKNIRRLLWEDWDPIGVNDSAPNDEYDSYADRIFSMVNRGSGESDIAEYLFWAETENMGLGGPNYDDAVRRNASVIAAKIMKLW